jgi:hypothetical protein
MAESRLAAARIQVRILGPPPSMRSDAPATKATRKNTARAVDIYAITAETIHPQSETCCMLRNEKKNEVL